MLIIKKEKYFLVASFRENLLVTVWVPSTYECIERGAHGTQRRSHDEDFWSCLYRGNPRAK